MKDVGDDITMLCLGRGERCMCQHYFRFYNHSNLLVSAQAISKQVLYDNFPRIIVLHIVPSKDVLVVTGQGAPQK